MSISNKVFRLYETDNTAAYRVACDCGHPDCDAVVEIEWDAKINAVFMSLYKQMTINDIQGDHSWWAEIRHRLKIAIQVLFTGYFETEGSMVFLEKNHLEMFLYAIKEGISKMKEGR